MENSIEYAKMIEIPINSCEYKFTRKKGILKKKSFIKAINERLKKEVDNKRLQDQNDQVISEQPSIEQIENEQLSTPQIEQGENSLPVLYDNNQSKKQTRLNKIISAQVVAIFALISAIILTNVFWENSGMNVLFKSVFGSERTQSDTRDYNDFTINLPVSDQNAINVVDGSIIIDGEYSLYPVCDGKVSKVERASDGTYTVTVEHSESFSSITEGLEMVYFSSGESVSKHVPLGYTSGTAKVLLYDGASLLTDYASVENCIVFNK